MTDSRLENTGSVWTGDPQSSGLFTDFPLPLVLVGDAPGKLTTNRCFDRLLDPSSLELEPVAAAVAAPGAAWFHAQVVGRDGTKLPMRVQALRAVTGVLVIFDEAPTFPGGDQIESLRSRVAELERTSATDSLTGAWNRAHFNRVVEIELSRSLRMRQSLSLIILDIDHFKNVNDTWGHATGDIVLCDLVSLILRRLRGEDQLFRWGGEEFAVLAPATAVGAASVLAESLRDLVETHEFPRVGRITISAGVAEHLATESAQVWFRRADASLYDAKGSGRNLVKIDPASESTMRGGNSRGATRLVWHDAYESGHPLIDEQHRELFARANALIDAVSTIPSVPAVVQQAFADLLGHVDRHFRDEEELLGRMGYERLEAHSRTHDHLRRRVAELKAAADAGKGRHGELVEFLSHDIVARHLFSADADFFPLFSSARGADAVRGA